MSQVKFIIENVDDPDCADAVIEAVQKLKVCLGFDRMEDWSVEDNVLYIGDMQDGGIYIGL